MTLERRSMGLSFFSLFTSASTLVCCALPALLVTLGMGAAVGGLVSAFPQLRWLTLHKTELFVIAGVLLLVAGIFQYRMRYAPCPLDPLLAQNCMRVRFVSRVVYFVSVGIYAIGFFFAFLAAKIFF